MPSMPQASHTALSSPTPTQTAPTDPSPDQDYFKAEHPMSHFNQSDSVGNYSNELGDRSDAEGHGTLFNIDPIPGQHQSSQLADGANTIPPGTSIDAAAPKKMRKRKSGSSDGAKQKEKVKIQKNELASLEADIKFMKDQYARKLKYYKRARAIVDSLKKKNDEVTDKLAELGMELIENNNESG
ncbi:hypothetical protein IMY05_003G0113700 [Salix suchowensis]|nr:hypothetical protein IMY05_003G0113700 [Salix suchowensis]